MRFYGQTEMYTPFTLVSPSRSRRCFAHRELTGKCVGQGLLKHLESREKPGTHLARHSLPLGQALCRAQHRPHPGSHLLAQESLRPVLTAQNTSSSVPAAAPGDEEVSERACTCAAGHADMGPSCTWPIGAVASKQHCLSPTILSAATSP